ncbi:ATP-binding protein [Humidisolicoccus flavus]|uniref:ATP-binding protein n=1 Tax=Humidisolicoccus flavus TaxID=3111414 RepID=UPI0032444F3E
MTESVDHVETNDQPMITLIDGRSGSGKTSFAELIAHRLDAQIVHMDDLYLGWDGLQAGSDYAHEHVLVPLSEGNDARWQRWDWASGERAEWQRHPAGTPLILEGCGSLSRANHALAERSFWLEAPESVRHRRILLRDGDDSWWEGWKAQETEFYDRERSASLPGVRRAVDEESAPPEFGAFRTF